VTYLTHLVAREQHEGPLCVRVVLVNPRDKRLKLTFLSSVASVELSMSDEEEGVVFIGFVL
jgi:hypothetical protein